MNFQSNHNDQKKQQQKKNLLKLVTNRKLKLRAQSGGP